MLPSLWRDVRHACRSLRATPAFTLVALAVLTLSIGASTIIFSLVDGVLLRALPFPAPDRLVAIGERHLRTASDREPNLVAPQNFIDWRAQQTVFTGIAAVGYASVSVKAEAGQEPETLEAQAVTADFFSVLGSTPLVGRTFTADNEVNGRALVVVEVALSAVLLTGSGLFLASFARVAAVDLGLDPRDVLAVRIRPLVGAHNWELAQQRHRGLLADVLDRVRAIPGVQAAALVSGGVPLRGDLRTIEFAIPGRVLPPDEDLDFNEISPDYFRVMRVPLMAGRFFSEADRQGSEPVVIVNEAAARRYFPGENPVGRTVSFQGVRRIVGVVGNIRHDGPETDWRRQGFVPLEQSRAVGATLVLRLSRGAGEVLPAVKSAIWSQFPGLALPDVQMLSQYLDDLIAQRRFNMLLLGVFGLLGTLIACVGIYGVMAYVVVLRTREIGIRLALGAVPAAILRSVLGRAATYVISGLAIGLPAAWVLGGLVASFLFQVRPHDPWIFAAVAVTLGATGLLAAFLPSSRAARVDPLVALRLE